VNRIRLCMPKGVRLCRLFLSVMFTCLCLIGLIDSKPTLAVLSLHELRLKAFLIVLPDRLLHLKSLRSLDLVFNWSDTALNLSIRAVSIA
jgi:hypothetical protein